MRTDLTTFVSLNPCLDAILVEVARPEQILALSHYSHDPDATSMDVERARIFQATGGTAEEVIALAPDVVLASSFIAPATRKALEDAGLRVESFGSPATVDESLSQVERLADLAGDAANADRLLGDMTASPWPPVNPPDATGKRQPLSPDPSVLLWQEGEIVPGETTLIAQLLRESGFVDHAAAMGLQQGDRVSLERVLVDPPDMLLVAGGSRGQNHPVLQSLGDRVEVHPFDPRLFYCGGPSIPVARATLADIRYGFEEHAR